MKVRKLLVTDIRCRTCNAGPGQGCVLVVGCQAFSGAFHGERVAEHAELERAGWQWQEVNPYDANPNRRGGD